jgi:dTDP-4-dehydrorhamnose 3,5-epimerase
MKDKFQKQPTFIKDLWIIKPTIFRDSRGFLLEEFNQDEFQRMGLPISFSQDIRSRSVRNVIRGLHFQLNIPMGKLVRVPLGEVFDVAVDLRKGSPSFGKYFGIHLNENNMQMLYVPPGFAHGFCVLSEIADVVYKFTTPWVSALQKGIKWDDPFIQINWPIPHETVSLSHKDSVLPLLKDIDENIFFNYREDI